MARRIIIKRSAKIKGIPCKISQGMKKELDKVISDYKNLGIYLSYAEACEIYRRNK